MTFPMPTFMPAEVAAFSATNLGASSQTTDALAFTFSSCDLGATAATRLIVVTIGVKDASTGFTLSSVTINGVSATSIVDATETQASVRGKAIIVAATVPTGTSGDIVVTFTGATAIDGCAISWYRIANPTSTTAHDTIQGDSTNTGTIDCPAGGIIIGRSQGINTGTGSWTGLANQTQEVDIDTTDYASDAYEVFASTQTGRTITKAGTAADMCLAVASWR